MSSYEIRQGDVLDRLREMADESVHCVVTSPPYWSLRDYGTGQWAGGDAECDHRMNGGRDNSNKTAAKLTAEEGHPDAFRNGTAYINQGEAYKDLCGKCGATRIDKQLGLEATPDEFVANMVAVFREVWRVLRKDGTCWVNMGDSYVAGPTGHQDISNAKGKAADMFAKGGRYRVDNLRKDTVRKYGALKAKDLCMIPARLALALQSDGWWIRSEITWCKRAPMPESVRDRPTSATEKIYLLTKSDRYFYDLEAVRQAPAPNNKAAQGKTLYVPPLGSHRLAEGYGSAQRAYDEIKGANMWNYWLLSPDPYAEAHFATFPREIPRRAILAGTSERGVCGACGAPWRRVVERERLKPAAPSGNREIGRWSVADNAELGGRTRPVGEAWEPTCTHTDAHTVPGTVLDPFSGAGTTLLVAVQLGRRGLGIELNPEYIEMANRRIHNNGAPLFSWADGQVKEAV